jgi:hypothetical protein
MFSISSELRSNGTQRLQGAKISVLRTFCGLENGYATDVSVLRTFFMRKTGA